VDYMQKYIDSHRKRRGGTDILLNSIQLYRQHGAGSVFWGVGLMSELPPYWYVINYGKKMTGEPFIPGMGKTRPVVFSDGNADPTLRGAGTGEKYIHKKITGGNEPIPSVVRPMNYIQATRARLNANINNLLKRLKKV